ncbi:MAG TPA: phosphatase PAP2 family protein [Methylococcus sp.]|nr:phosphatase PAP2 family protein [Methylococcus sp.]
MKLIDTIQEYDAFMFFWFMNRKHLERCVQISRWISRSGDGYLYLLLGVYCLVSGTAHDRLLLRSTLLAFLIERPLYFALKNGLRRNRPAVALKNFRSFIVPADRFSFPSGHTSAAFLVATLIGAFHPPLQPLLYGWAALVGLSRIFLGVHFPGDVLMGMTMGSSIAVLSLGVLSA